MNSILKSLYVAIVMAGLLFLGGCSKSGNNVVYFDIKPIYGPSIVLDRTLSINLYGNNGIYKSLPITIPKEKVKCISYAANSIKYRIENQDAKTGTAVVIETTNGTHHIIVLKISDNYILDFFNELGFETNSKLSNEDKSAFENI